MSWIAATLPPALLVVCVALWGVDVPYWDQWTAVPIVTKMFEGRLELADVWAQHYDHRVFFPRLLTLALARLSSWNIRWEMACSVVLASVIFLAVTRALRVSAAESPRRHLVAPAVSLLVFNLNQWENWSFGQQTVFFVVAAATTGGLLLLAKGAEKPRYLMAAGALGAVATYSFSSGLLFWPLSLPLVLLAPGKRRRRLATWALIATGVLTLHFSGYSHPTGMISVPDSIRGLALFAVYICVFLGAPVASFDGKLAFFCGLAAVAAAALLAFRLLRDRERDPRATWLWIAFSGFGLGCGALTALGRLEFGLELAMSSRYISAANFFWLGLLGLWLEAATGAGTGRRTAARFARRGSGLLMAISLIASSIWGGTLFHRQFLERTEAKTALLAGRLHRDHPHLLTGNRIAPEWIDALRRHRLSLFRDAD